MTGYVTAGTSDRPRAGHARQTDGLAAAGVQPSGGKQPHRFRVGAI